MKTPMVPSLKGFAHGGGGLHASWETQSRGWGEEVRLLAGTPPRPESGTSSCFFKVLIAGAHRPHSVSHNAALLRFRELHYHPIAIYYARQRHRADPAASYAGDYQGADYTTKRNFDRHSCCFPGHRDVNLNKELGRGGGGVLSAPLPCVRRWENLC